MKNIHFVIISFFLSVEFRTALSAGVAQRPAAWRWRGYHKRSHVSKRWCYLPAVSREHTPAGAKPPVGRRPF